MTRTIRKVNETRYHLDNMVEACKQKIIALESAKAILLLDHQKTQKIQLQKQPLDKLFYHTLARQLTKIHQI